VALDKVVFIADKIAWDQAGMPPYLPQVCDALERSLDLAVYRYLDHLWAQRERLAVIHPWFVEAYDQLGRRLMSRVQER
jgi:HD superfamily phosphohydrolase YqeK